VEQKKPPKLESECGEGKVRDILFF